MIKKEIRILGVDDAPFDKFKSRNVRIIGAVFRGGQYLDGVISTTITVDGVNSTSKLITLINKTKHKDQLQIIMLDGIAFGGFNVVDIHKLSEKTKLPVITVMRDYPNFRKIKRALNNVKNPKRRLSLIEKAGEIHEVSVLRGKIYIQLSNITLEKAKEILDVACTRSLVPEPVRVAHLIASGVVTGESRGRA